MSVSAAYSCRHRTVTKSGPCHQVTRTGHLSWSSWQHKLRHVAMTTAVTTSMIDQPASLSLLHLSPLILHLSLLFLAHTRPHPFKPYSELPSTPMAKPLMIFSMCTHQVITIVSLIYRIWTKQPQVVPSPVTTTLFAQLSTRLSHRRSKVLTQITKTTTTHTTICHL